MPILFIPRAVFRHSPSPNFKQRPFSSPSSVVGVVVGHGHVVLVNVLVVVVIIVVVVRIYGDDDEVHHQEDGGQHAEDAHGGLGGGRSARKVLSPSRAEI